MKQCLDLLFKKADTVTLTNDQLEKINLLFESFMHAEIIEKEDEKGEDAHRAFLSQLDEPRIKRETTSQREDIFAVLYDMLIALKDNDKARTFWRTRDPFNPTIELLRIATLATTIGLKIGTHSSDFESQLFSFVHIYNQQVSSSHKLRIEDYGLMERKAYCLLGLLSHPDPYYKPHEQLHAAIKENNFGRVNEILKLNVDINARDKEFHKSALDFAAMRGNRQIMERLLAVPKIMFTPEEIGIHSSLYLAIIHQEKSAAMMLLDNGARLTLVDYNPKNKDRLLAAADKINLSDRISPLMKLSPQNQQLTRYNSPLIDHAAPAPTRQGTSYIQLFSRFCVFSCFGQRVTAAEELSSQPGTGLI